MVQVNSAFRNSIQKHTMRIIKNQLKTVSDTPPPPFSPFFILYIS